MSKLSTDSYKGVRDFYPEEMFVQEHIFSTWKRVAERFGYQEYNASVLEPADLYKSKTSEEIVNEQTYTFKDRGDRDVTLRPEMTPTVARMVAGRKRELGFPVRWYSIPNLFRYEQPQRGRLREHWQLNVDVFGLKSIEADIEIITLTAEIMKAFGANSNDYEIRINDRLLIDIALRDMLKLDNDAAREVTRLLDKWEKIPQENMRMEFEKLVPLEMHNYFALFVNIFTSDSPEELLNFIEYPEITRINTVISALRNRGINTIFAPTMVRGFDYYTGIVFEVFDTNPANRRSLFGGGRYDNLLALFGGDSVPAVGFGMGDVTMRDFLETHNLLPQYHSSARLSLCPMNASLFEHTSTLAARLREDGVNVAVDWTGRKTGDQIKAAAKLGIPYIIVIGEDEAKQHAYKVKNLSTGEETPAAADKIAALIK